MKKKLINFTIKNQIKVLVVLIIKLDDSNETVKYVKDHEKFLNSKRKIQNKKNLRKHLKH